MPPSSPAPIFTFPKLQPEEERKLPDECCGRCRHVHVIMPPDGAPAGTMAQLICRRNPPQWFLAAVPVRPNGIIHGGRGGQPQMPVVFENRCMQPITALAEWCAEWEISEGRRAELAKTT